MSAGASRLSRAWSTTWLKILFFCAERLPGLTRVARPIVVRGAWRTSPALRETMRKNAKRLIGPDLGEWETRDYAVRVLEHFYDAVAEMGSSRAGSAEDIARRPHEIVGRELYLQARAPKHGAILVTAHLGSFETAIGILKEIEPRIHVVFQRDRFELFERMRSRQRTRLGVNEAPVDDGIATWIALRDALMHDEVVLLQGDRCMEGQQGARAAFLGGHLMVPTGPARLARLTGSPIIPTFAVRQPDDTIRVMLTEAIEPSAHPIERGKADPIIALITRRIEEVVRAHPEQWLCLHPVLVEDQASVSVS